MRILCTVTLILIGISGFTQKLELLDIYELEFVSDPQISPDGNKILYVRNFKDVMTDKNLSNIWIINFDGSENRPVTTGSQADNSPRWVSDNHIIYKSNKSGSSQVYQLWLDSRAEQQLTKDRYSATNIAISPDRRSLAFTRFVEQRKEQFIKMPAKPEGAKWNDPPVYIDELNYRGDGQGYLKSGSRQLFILSLDGGTAMQVTDGDQDYGAPVWTPDGKSLVFSANLKEDSDYDPRNSEVYTLNLGTGVVTALTSRQGPDFSPRVSPDGRKIAYLGFDDRFQGYQQTQLYVMNIDGSGSKLISRSFEFDPGNVQWKEGGNGFYLQFIENGATKIASMHLNGKYTVLASNLGGMSLGRPYSSGTFSASGDRYAFTWGAGEHPADLGSGEGTSTRRLTNLNSDVLSRKKPGKVEEIWFKSSFDQRDVQGWIVYPPDFDPARKYPLLLEIHGGPFLSYSPWFAAEIQLYASAGYVVLYANPRGSTSYGEEFANLIHHNYPGEDYDDLMSGVDAVIAKGFIDEDNLFVTGGSGGGVLSSWIIGKTDRFKAAVVAKPVINWYSFVLYADGPAFFYKYWFPGLPWEHTEHYMKRSPISLVGNVKTPTMVLTGEEDYRTPIAETEQYYAALKIQKVDAAMVRIPGASHGIANQPSNLVAKVAAILSWFDKYRTDEMEGVVERR